MNTHTHDYLCEIQRERNGYLDLHIASILHCEGERGETVETLTAERRAELKAEVDAAVRRMREGKDGE
jgi:hypothetical protein